MYLLLFLPPLCLSLFPSSENKWLSYCQELPALQARQGPNPPPIPEVCDNPVEGHDSTTATVKSIPVICADQENGSGAETCESTLPTTRPWRSGRVASIASRLEQAAFENKASSFHKSSRQPLLTVNFARKRPVARENLAPVNHSNGSTPTCVRIDRGDVDRATHVDCPDVDRSSCSNQNDISRSTCVDSPGDADVVLPADPRHGDSSAHGDHSDENKAAVATGSLPEVKVECVDEDVPSDSDPVNVCALSCYWQ